jgi:hypothetical protein
MKSRLAPRLAAGALPAALAAAFATLAPLAAVAATPSTSAPPAAATKTMLPAEQQYDGIRYATGGVTAEEAAVFKREMHGYPLAIELVEKQKKSKHDEYTADAMVKISKAGKDVFDAKAKGPFMLVRLEPGTYDISATLGKHTLHKKHVVVARGRTALATFEFPAGTD